MVEQDVLIDIRERVVRIETMLESQKEIKEDVDELSDCVQEQGKQIVDIDARSKSNTHQIKEIKDNLTWLWRTIAGALIVIGLSAAVWVIKQGGV